MKRTVLIAFTSILVFGFFWLWPAFHQPADHSCAADEPERLWSYKIGSRKWDCGEWGWHIRVGDSVYGFSSLALAQGATSDVSAA